MRWRMWQRRRTRRRRRRTTTEAAASWPRPGREGQDSAGLASGCRRVQTRRQDRLLDRLLGLALSGLLLILC